MPKAALWSFPEALETCVKRCVFVWHDPALCRYLGAVLWLPLVPYQAHVLQQVRTSKDQLSAAHIGTKSHRNPGKQMAGEAHSASTCTEGSLG